MRPLWPAALALLLPLTTHADEGIAPRAEGWLRGDLHFHTNHSDDAREQGGDWVGRALAIAEYWEDPTFVDAFPFLAGNGMDFLAITDHRDIQGCSDPEFTSERLILLCGEEFGSNGHAGAWGITERIGHEPTDGRTENEQIQFAIDQVNAMGGVFSPNHPLYEGDLWFWDVEGYAAIEVWNSYWTLLETPSTEADLDEQVANHGLENPYIRPAIQLTGASYNQQSVRFWEAHLTVGRNLAVVGGSDRHMLVMAAQPMTYVKAQSATPDGVLQAIRDRHTFVSRGPAAPQAVLTVVDRLGRVSMMGDNLRMADGPFTLRLEVSRAAGGRVRWIEGRVDPALDVVGAMDDLTLSQVVEEVDVDQDLVVLERPWDPGSPAWTYAVVLDPLRLSDLPPVEWALARALLRDMDEYGEDYVRLGLHLLPLLDVQDLIAPRFCDPDEWDVDRTTCVEVDDVFLGTFYLAEPFNRVGNVFRERDANTPYAMGAITSALMVR